MLIQHHVLNIALKENNSKSRARLISLFLVSDQKFQAKSFSEMQCNQNQFSVVLLFNLQNIPEHESV